MDQPQYSAIHLKNLLELYRHICGEFPKQLEVKKEFLDACNLELKGLIETYGITAKDQTLQTFKGVKLIEKAS